MAPAYGVGRHELERRAPLHPTVIGCAVPRYEDRIVGAMEMPAAKFKPVSDGGDLPFHRITSRRDNALHGVRSDSRNEAPPKLTRAYSTTEASMSV